MGGKLRFSPSTQKCQKPKTARNTCATQGDQNPADTVLAVQQWIDQTYTKHYTHRSYTVAGMSSPIASPVIATTFGRLTAPSA